MNLYDIVTPMTMDEAKATKQRLDAKCWTGYKKQGTKVKGGVRVNNCVPKESVEEDSWHAGDNAWSSENHEMFEGHSFSNGDQVELKPEYADKAGEVYTVSQCDAERGRCWIGDADGRGWYARFDQLVPSVEPEEFDEGYQDFNKVEPYYVCIGGKPWKKFDYYEDARRAHDNLKKKWYKEGNPKYDTVTLMPVMDEAGSPAQQAAIAIAKKKEQGVEEALSRKDLLKQIGDKLNDPEFRKQPADSSKRWEKGDLYQGPGPDDYGYTGYQGHGMPRDKPKKKKGVAEMDKSQKGAAGWNIDDYDYNKGKWTQGKPVTANQATKDMEQELTKAFNRNKEPEPSGIKKKNEFNIKESYWTKLQNERNTKLNSLVNELKESIKK